MALLVTSPLRPRRERIVNGWYRPSGATGISIQGRLPGAPHVTSLTSQDGDAVLATAPDSQPGARGFQIASGVDCLAAPQPDRLQATP
jgi:hypothetical protein